MDHGFWSEYAADEAMRFLEGWDFYRRYGDAGTLEISPSVSGAGGTFPPDVNVTVRFDHSWPGPGGGRYEQTALMEEFGTWDYWFRELYGPPYVIDGKSAHGSTVTCIEGFYLDTDADACLPFTPCPAGSALYDGVCITGMACRGTRGSYLIDGELWRCPPGDVLDAIAAGRSGGGGGPRPGPAPHGGAAAPGGIGWRDYAERAALRFVDGWGFYQHFAENGTLEIVPLVGNRSGGGAPELAATVRFDYMSINIGPTSGAGTFEHTLSISVPPGDYRMPVMVDGEPSPGVDVECPTGYFNRNHEDGCSRDSQCLGDTDYDGGCEFVSFCDYFYGGRWYECRGETAEDYDALVRQYTGQWDPIILDVLQFLAIVAASVLAPVLLWRRLRGRRRGRVPARGGTAGRAARAPV